jgi:hypothetical protein
VTGNGSDPPIANPDKPVIDSITSGTLKFFVYGRMDYVDVFQAQHWTIFCFQLTKNVEWNSCPMHNDTDNNPEQ